MLGGLPFANVGRYADIPVGIKRIKVVAADAVDCSAAALHELVRTFTATDVQTVVLRPGSIADVFSMVAMDDPKAASATDDHVRAYGFTSDSYSVGALTFVVGSSKTVLDGDDVLAGSTSGFFSYSYSKSGVGMLFTEPYTTRAGGSTTVFAINHVLGQRQLIICRNEIVSASAIACSP